jgi:hypothetical protein
MRKQHVLQGRPALYAQRLTQRQQLNMDEIAHGAAAACHQFTFAPDKLESAPALFERIQRNDRWTRMDTHYKHPKPCLYSFGEALGWLWGRIGEALESQSVAYQQALRWL